MGYVSLHISLYVSLPAPDSHLLFTGEAPRRRIMMQHARDGVAGDVGNSLCTPYSLAYIPPLPHLLQPHVIRGLVGMLILVYV